MTRTFLAIAALAALSIFATQAQAAPIVVDWENSGGDNNFDNDTITNFTAFTANTLTGVADLDDPAAYYTRYYLDSLDTDPILFGAIEFFLDIKLDGNWTTIWSDELFFDIPEDERELADSIGTPISFTEGTVSGIRFRSEPPTGHPKNYRKFDGLQLTFDTIPTPDATAVPEPTSMALLAVGGVGLAGGAIRRRRLRKAAAA